MVLLIEILDEDTTLISILIKQHSQLISLNLSHNKITDRGLYKLLEALISTKITELDLSMNRLTQKALPKLKETLPKLVNLKTLIVKGLKKDNQLSKGLKLISVQSGFSLCL